MPEKIRSFINEYGAVPIPSRCPILDDCCIRHSCHHYRHDDLTHDLGERCAESNAVAAAVDRHQREIEYRGAANTDQWHRAEQLAKAALQDREMTDAQRDAWRAPR